MSIVDKIRGGMTPAQYYSAENRGKEYDIRDAGCYVDGSHDDTANVQATINEAATHGGGTIIIPDTGNACIIDGAVQTIGTNDAYGQLYGQLYIPSKSHDDLGRVNIKIKGETEPNLMQSAGIGGAKSPNTGSRILSTLVNNAANAFVIASKGAATNYQSFNYNQCNIENVSIQVTPDSNSKITIGGIGFNNAANAVIKNVTIFPFNLNLVGSAAPLNDPIGIAMPRLNCEWFGIVQNTNVGGFTSGFLLGEHTSLINTVAVCCINGYNFGHNSHHARGINLSSFWCVNDVYVSAYCFFRIDALQVEKITAQGYWYDSVYTLLDATDLGHGEIHYCINWVNGGVNALATKSGGVNIQCMKIAYDVAAEFTITGARNTGEGALKDLIAKLVAQGIIIDGTTAS